MYSQSPVTVKLFLNPAHYKEHQDFTEIARLMSLDGDKSDALDALQVARTFVLDTFVSTQSEWIHDYAVKTKGEPVDLSQFCADAVQWAMTTTMGSDGGVPVNTLIQAHDGYFAGLSRFVKATKTEQNDTQSQEIAELFSFVAEHGLERSGKAVIVFTTSEIVEENTPLLAKIGA